MSEDVIKIIVEAIITICMALITGFLIPWIKSKLNLSQREQLEKVVRVAVMAAEQLIPSEKWQEKKEYVCNYLTTLGYDTTTEEIDNLIESIVLQVKAAYRSTSNSSVNSVNESSTTTENSENAGDTE